MPVNNRSCSLGHQYAVASPFTEELSHRVPFQGQRTSSALGKQRAARGSQRESDSIMCGYIVIIYCYYYGCWQSMTIPFDGRVALTGSMHRALKWLILPTDLRGQDLEV